MYILSNFKSPIKGFYFRQLNDAQEKMTRGIAACATHTNSDMSHKTRTMLTEKTAAAFSAKPLELDMSDVTRTMITAKSAAAVRGDIEKKIESVPSLHRGTFGYKYR